MNIDDIKIYGGFLASMVATISNVETILKIAVFGVTIVYTIYKIIDLQETRNRNKKNDES